MDTFIFYGINPVLESLRSPLPPLRVHLQAGKDNPGLHRIRALAGERGVPIARSASVERLCGSRDHQGVCAESADIGIRPLTVDVPGPRMVMLDGIQDPHNFGAVLRVCDAFGVRDVIFHKGNSSGVTPAAVKVSTGAIFHLNLYLSNLNAAVRRLQRAGVMIYALDGEGDTDIRELPVVEPYCLVIGSEGDGVRHVIRRLADRLVKIPMRGQVNSLNVSCALSAVLAVLTLRGSAISSS